MTINLRGHRVLVTRPHPRGETLCRLIEEAGGKSILLPTLEIIPDTRVSPRGLALAFSDASSVIFVSRNAVICSRRLVDNLPAALQTARIFAVGEGTMQELAAAGVNNVIVPARESSSEALLERKELQARQIKGRKVLVVRGNGGRELLGNTLQARGACVDFMQVYRRQRPFLPPGSLQRIWREQRPDIIVVTSEQGLRNLIGMTGTADRKALFTARLVVISSRLADIAGNAGFARPAIAKEQSDHGLLHAIEETVEKIQDEC